MAPLARSPAVFERAARPASRGVVAIVVVAAGALVGACDRSPPPPSDFGRAELDEASLPGSGSIKVSGSSALQPLVNVAKEEFERSHPGVSVEVSAGGSHKGLADVASGVVQIGTSDVEAPPELAGDLVDHRVAVMAFAVMANAGPHNAGVRSLRTSDLAGVFSGTIDNWKALGGGDMPIVVIHRAVGSGTRAVFERAILRGAAASETRTEDNSGALVFKLERTPGAISYLATSFARESLRVFALDDGHGPVEPTDRNVFAGRYPLWSWEHFYTRGPAQGPTATFIEHVLSPRFQDATLPTVKGFLPVRAMGDAGAAGGAD